MQDSEGDQGAGQALVPGPRPPGTPRNCNLCARRQNSSVGCGFDGEGISPRDALKTLGYMYSSAGKLSSDEERPWISTYGVSTASLAMFAFRRRSLGATVVGDPELRGPGQA